MVRDELWFKQQVICLSERLERLTPDSIWARKASGVRRSLLRWQLQLEQGSLGQRAMMTELEKVTLYQTLMLGYRFLELAANAHFRE